VLNVRPLEPFGTSDHCQVEFHVMLTSETDRHAFKTSDFRFADREKIKAYLASINFYQLFYSNLPAPAILDEFYKIINTCNELYVPEKINVSSKKLRLVKYPYRIRRMLRQKATMWRVYRTFKTPNSLASYKKVA
jgi:hypothetical protein